VGIGLVIAVALGLNASYALMARVPALTYPAAR